MVVIAILGVLAAIAIPRFNESTAKANTARVQADLRTIDSASVQYQACLLYTSKRLYPCFWTSTAPISLDA